MRNYRAFGKAEEEYLRNQTDKIDNHIIIIFTPIFVSMLRLKKNQLNLINFTDHLIVATILQFRAC